MTKPKKTNNNMDSVSARIRYVRLNRGYNQDELAEMISRSRQRINQVEKSADQGERMTVEMLRKFAKALDVSPCYLLMGEERDVQDNELAKQQNLTNDLLSKLVKLVEKGGTLSRE